MASGLQCDFFPANPAQIQQFNFAHNAVDAALGAMRRHEPTFSLPVDFFDCEVIGVPPPPPKAPTAAVVQRTGALPLQHCGSEKTGGGGSAPVEIS